MDAIKLFLDTNIVLDYFSGRMNNDSAEKIVQIGQFSEYKLCISILSAINILYFSNKYAPSLRPDDISKLFQILPMDYEQFKDAQAIRIGDFENALQVECARKNNCKVIISRDSDLLNSDISYPIILSPEVFLKRYTE